MADLRRIAEDIKTGMSCESHRLLNARINKDYYQGKFSPYWNFSCASHSWEPERRPSKFLSFVVDHVSNLYRDNPNRVIIGNPDVTTFLQDVYSHNCMFAKWHAAEQLTAISDTAAFQVAGTADPKQPIKVTLWSADSFWVYTEDDDPLRVDGVVTTDFVVDKKRFTVWTKGRLQVYEGVPQSESNAASVILVKDEVNPYGIIPFSFVHYHYPTLEFHSGGIGTNLREANRYLNHILSLAAGSVIYCSNPIVLTRHLDPTWQPPTPVKPGDWLKLAGEPDGDGAEHDPEVEYLQPNNSFVEAIWNDILSYINHTLEMNGIPESAIRMVQSVARSGSSIVAEQYPLIQHAKAKQPAYRHYEYDLAKLVIEIANVHFRNNKVVKPTVRLAAEKGFELSVTYTNKFADVPGQERDLRAQWEVDHGYTSEVMVYQDRSGCTREEALAHFARVMQDKTDLAKIMGIPLAPDEDESNAEDLERQEEENERGEKEGSDGDTDTGLEGSDDSDR